MINKAVCNLLIPFSFEMADWEKIDDCQEIPQKETVEDIKRDSLYSSKEWFAYCFKDLPVNETFQMGGSPLLNTVDGTMVKRVEFNQPVRALLGVHKNENRICTLKKEKIDFRFGKIRLLLFKTGLGMIHLEITSNELSTDELLNFTEQITAIQKDIKYTYENKVAKDSVETVNGSIKELVGKILSIQTYVKFSPYKKETFGKAYIQEYITGDIDQGIMPQFFEMLRNQRRSNMRSATGVGAGNLYNPFEYITWVSGERSLICYGNLSICGDDNMAFLTEPGGLVKSIDLNYVTIYAYLIEIQLMTRDAESNKDKELIDELHILPVANLSAETHINELFDVYLSSNTWRLSERISDIYNANQNGIDEKLSTLSSQVDQMTEDFSERLSGLSQKTDYLVKQVDQLVSFTNNELKSYLDNERCKLQNSSLPDQDKQVGAFIEHTSSYIDEKVALSGDEIVKKEREGLSMLFGERWNCLLTSSQTSLVSAGALLKRCSDINTPDFDFSGICICATAALEAELKRVFFDGLLEYMVSNYGNPGSADVNEIYKYWPDVLLTVPKFQYERGTNAKVRKVSHFTMGNLPFLFGETGRLSDIPSVRTNQMEQAKMMKDRMAEYLATIVLDYYKAMPFEAFYLEDMRVDRITCQAGSFVWKCERIRENYRNKAAHVNVMSEEEASSCYQSIITKPDTYVYNAEIAGAILELFCKIDGTKLSSISNGRVADNKPVSVASEKNSVNGFSIGQIVELENLEVTSKGVLRGTIVDSAVGASLSKKHLSDVGIYPRQYLGKKISVKLVRWDENGQKYNAEWAESR